MHVDLSGVLGPGFDFPNEPAEDYIAMISAPNRLGNPLVGTQHLLGASTWERTAERNITAAYQFRAQHVRFGDNGNGSRTNEQLRAAVIYGTVEHYFHEEGDGKWKLSGLRPTTFFEDCNVTAIFE